MNPFWTITASMARSSVDDGGQPPAPADKWFANGQSDIVSFFGAEAEYCWLPGSVSSGDVPDTLGNGADLADFGLPDYEQAFTGEAGDPLCVLIANGADEGFASSNTNDLSWPDESWLVLTAIKLNVLDDNIRNLFGRFNTSNFRGFIVGLKEDTWGTGNLYFEAIIQGSSSMALWAGDMGVVQDTSPHFFALWHHAGNQEQGVYTDIGSTNSVDTTAAGTINPTGSPVFKLGAIQASNSIPAGFALAIAFRGSAAETIIADLTVIDDWWAS